MEKEQEKQIRNKLTAIGLSSQKMAAEKNEIDKLVKEIKEILDDENKNS
jgi:hypothetical protein